MEISMMVAQLKSKAETVEAELNEKKKREKSLRLELGALEQEIKSMSDEHSALIGAIDKLKPVCKEVSPVGGIHAIKVPAKEKYHNTRPMPIGKFDVNGNKIGEYRSVSQAAKEFGWANTPMKKYILSESKEKQIRIRGFYLEFLAA